MSQPVVASIDPLLENLENYFKLIVNNNLIDQLFTLLVSPEESKLSQPSDDTLQELRNFLKHPETSARTQMYLAAKSLEHSQCLDNLPHRFDSASFFSAIEDSEIIIRASVNTNNAQNIISLLPILIQNLPPHISSLTLVFHSSWLLKAEGFKKIFTNVPPSITTLKILEDSVNVKCAKELLGPIEALHSSLTTLRLNWTRLHLLDKESLQSLFQQWPTTITHLDIFDTFDDNNLEFLEVLPSKIQSLTLVNSEKNIANLSKLPPNVHSLKLSITPLDKTSNFSLSAIKHVHYLDLSKNILSALEANISSIFKDLSPKIKRLNLSNNHLGCLKGIHLTQIIDELPHIEELDLSHNSLWGPSPNHNLRAYNKSSLSNSARLKEIMGLMKQISPKLKHLDLSNNEIEISTLEEAQQFADSLPETLQSLNLQGNSISNKAAEIIHKKLLNKFRAHALTMTAGLRYLVANFLWAKPRFEKENGNCNNFNLESSHSEVFDACQIAVQQTLEVHPSLEDFFINTGLEAQQEASHWGLQI